MVNMLQVIERVKNGFHDLQVVILGCENDERPGLPKTF